MVQRLAVLMGAALAISAPAGAAQLSLTWTDNAGGTATVKVERKLEAAGIYAQIATTPLGATSYIDATVTPGVTYCYRIRASNAGGDSDYSNEGCAMVAALPPPDPEPLPSYTLVVIKTGKGTGAITSDLGGILCGADCTEAYTSGTMVTLSAVPTSRSAFAGWSGACSGTGSCTVTLTDSTVVTATFTRRHGKKH